MRFFVFVSVWFRLGVLSFCSHSGVGRRCFSIAEGLVIQRLGLWFSVYRLIVVLPQSGSPAAGFRPPAGGRVTFLCLPKEK
jgi:hypothetical protein